MFSKEPGDVTRNEWFEFITSIAGLILWMFLTFLLNEARLTERAEKYVVVQKLVELESRYALMNAPGEMEIRQLIRAMLAAQGVSQEYWSTMRALYQVESSCQHTYANGAVKTYAIRGQLMVGIGQINMKPGVRKWRKWDVYLLPGNIGASCEKLKDALDDHRTLPRAIAAYKGYKDIDSPRAKAVATKVLELAKRYELAEEER